MATIGFQGIWLKRQGSNRKLKLNDVVIEMVDALRIQNQVVTYYRRTKTKKQLILLNKVDLARPIPKQNGWNDYFTVMGQSINRSKDGKGIKQVKRADC